ncbi:MAG: proline--tRNA ligase [Methanobrevibacter sp.]|jgi:prolyl-tRNA synthetase|nr:proline--tRNA ligase [Candidatus Methanovirga meridionalis]
MEEFSQWFHNVLEEAEIIDSRYPIKGMSVWLPKGFKIRKHILRELERLMDKDHDEVLFPLLIPEAELAKEGIHVKGFEEEVYWVTHGGNKELNEKLAIRPTSETAIYPMFALWIRSHIDLPIKIYQTVNTMRYETKHTRPLIRVREITTFTESHTVHEMYDEAIEQVKEGIAIYKQLFDSLAIPYLIHDRPSWDKFPGADYTFAFDTLMKDGKTLQIGTVHNLGDTFAKTFDIKYEAADGNHKHPYQTCYGLSDRVIASLIAIHGDEKGLVLPPSIAPIQVTIVPIIFKDGGEEVLSKVNEVKDILEESGFRVNIDNRSIRPGKKYYDWELNGIPLRIDLGPRDLQNNKMVIIRRDTFAKEECSLNEDIVSILNSYLSKINDNLKEKAWNFIKTSMVEITDLNKIEETVLNGNIGLIKWCGDDDCGKEIEEKTNLDILGKYDETSGVCINCKKEAKYLISIAKTY